MAVGVLAFDFARQKDNASERSIVDVVPPTVSGFKATRETGLFAELYSFLYGLRPWYQTVFDIFSPVRLSPEYRIRPSLYRGIFSCFFNYYSSATVGVYRHTRSDDAEMSNWIGRSEFRFLDSSSSSSYDFSHSRTHTREVRVHCPDGMSKTDDGPCGNDVSPQHVCPSSEPLFDRCFGSGGHSLRATAWRGAVFNARSMERQFPSVASGVLST